MDSTSVSLLRRLQTPDRDVAWQRFVALYTPLIYHCGRREGLDSTDASDLVQEVLAVLVVKLPEFQYDPTRRFRGWLRTVTVNKARDLHRRQAPRPSTGLEETIERTAVASPTDLFEDLEYAGYMVKRALEVMKTEFCDEWWKACWKQVVEGQNASSVAVELGISTNSAYLAKSRIISRLRDELAGLIE